jgi:hypothetical protein
MANGLRVALVSSGMINVHCCENIAVQTELPESRRH